MILNFFVTTWVLVTAITGILALKEQFDKLDDVWLWLMQSVLVCCMNWVFFRTDNCPTELKVGATSAAVLVVWIVYPNIETNETHICIRRNRAPTCYGGTICN